MTKHTTVCVDVNGKYYDLSKEHPDWELYKRNKEKYKGKRIIFQPRFVKDAFTCTVEKCEILKHKNKK